MTSLNIWSFIHTVWDQTPTPCLRDLNIYYPCHTILVNADIYNICLGKFRNSSYKFHVAKHKCGVRLGKIWLVTIVLAACSSIDIGLGNYIFFFNYIFQDRALAFSNLCHVFIKTLNTSRVHLHILFIHQVYFI